MSETKWPAEFENGTILTDNAMSIMTEEVSPPGKVFASIAAAAKRPLLEVGAAYGNSTLPALAAGGTVIANDLSASELAVLAESAPEEHRRRLVLMPARFPDELPLAANSLSAVLAAQVLHFFDGPAVERAFARTFEWLEPGGAFLVVVMTPSLSYYHVLWPEYERRMAQGERWPGIFDPRPLLPPEWRGRLPEQVHLFDKPVLARCATEAGFTIESMEYFCFQHFPEKHRTDGREYIGLVARKPAVQ